MTVNVPMRRSHTALDRRCERELQRRGVLIVEDSVVQRRQMVSQLRSLGIALVFEAADGRAALWMLQSLAVCPALAIVDLEMPGMDGIEFAQQLATLEERPALLIASHADAAIMEAVETMIRASGLPVLGTVGKPVATEALIDIIDRIGNGESPMSAQGAATAHEDCGFLTVGDPDLAYSPRACLRTGRIVGVEALSRHTPSMSNHSLVAGITGLLPETSPRQLLEIAAWQLSAWVAADDRHSLALTLTAADLSSPTLLNDLLGALRHTGLASRRVTIQVSQSSLREEDATVMSAINRLRIGGFGLSLNDYCSGYSSIQWLARLPFTEIRIERELIGKAEHGPHSRLILAAAIELGQHLGLLTVADGVESSQQLQMLQEMGCDRAQGPVIGGPFDAGQIAGWLRDRESPDPARLRL